MTERLLGPKRGLRRRRGALLVGLVSAVALLSLMLISFAGATSVAGFEIDADHVAPPATAPVDALHSGNEGGNDWAAGSSGQGVFALSASLPHTAATNCYGSNIDKTAIAGTSALICDGNSDSKLTAFP